MTKSVFRVHPTINFARVGNSEKYYIAPETAAGLPQQGSKNSGGLPLKANDPGDGSKTISSDDLRDEQGLLSRQAARFRVYFYEDGTDDTYPSKSEGQEIKVGDEIKVDGKKKKVKAIIWQVHVANKKANNFSLDILPGSVISHYENGSTPPVRNPLWGSNLHQENRLAKLVIDPGPRVICALAGKSKKHNTEQEVHFAQDAASVPCYFDEENGKIEELPFYRKSFPSDNFDSLYLPTGDIATLGSLKVDADGRLLVLPSFGRAVAWNQDENPNAQANGDGESAFPPLVLPVDNDNWFDDTSCGPVHAHIVFEGDPEKGVKDSVEAFPGWVTSTDPAYAPQIQNMVTLWDSIYEAWVEDPALDVSPEIFDVKTQTYKQDYPVYFGSQIQPMFSAIGLQRWIANIGPIGVQAHEAIGEITADDDPITTMMAGLAYVRDPHQDEASYAGAPLMPLSLGDSGKSFLSVTNTQYFFLQQWDAGKIQISARGDKDLKEPLGDGEALDRNVLINCLGGRFSPGIDMTFIVRQPAMYYTDWRECGSGPFRILPKKLDYAAAKADTPFLGAGWVPLHTPEGVGLEPGDTSKYMALPWHTDYNTCATHQPSPAVPGEPGTLYWSWPAQRPVAVHVAEEVIGSKDPSTLPPQRYSVRGAGTGSQDLSLAGSYQQFIDIVYNWPRIGTVLQSTAIDGAKGVPDDYYLEASSTLSDVMPWPMNGDPNAQRPDQINAPNLTSPSTDIVSPRGGMCPIDHNEK